jgi:hypothetical protein
MYQSAHRTATGHAGAYIQGCLVVWARPCQLNAPLRHHEIYRHRYVRIPRKTRKNIVHDLNTTEDAMT